MSTRLATDKDRLIVTGLLLAIFVLGMGLRLYELDADSLWYDEILTATRAQMDLSSLVALLASGEEGEGFQVPLTFIVTHFFVLLFGSSHFIVRFQALLFGSLSILFAYKLGEILWTREVGLVGAFLLAVNPYHVEFSQEARHYGLMIFLSLLSLIFLLKALQKSEKGLWIGFILCTSLSLYNHHFAFLFLPAEVIFGTVIIVQNWLSHRRQDDHTSGIYPKGKLSAPAKQALMFSASLALVGVAYLPWLSALQASISKELGPRVLNTSLASLQPTLSLLYSVFSDYSGPPRVLLWAGLFLLGLASAGWKRTLLVLLWMGVPFIFVSVITPRHFLSSKYTLFILPLYLLVIARGTTAAVGWLHRPISSMSRDRKWLLMFTCFAVVLFGLLSLRSLSDYYLWQKEDWRAVTEYLQRNISQGDIVLADGKSYSGGGDSWYVFRCLAYYLGSLGLEGTPVLKVERELGARLWDVPEDHGQVWAVLWYPERPASWEAADKIEVIDFKDVSVIRLRGSSGDVLQDTPSMLRVLLKLLPPEARFDVHLALAEVYRGMEKDAQAALQVELARWVKPDHEGACIDLGDAYLEQGRLEEAASEYERAIELAPARPGAYGGLGVVYKRLGEFEEAVAVYQQAIKASPATAWPHEELGRLYVELDRLEEAAAEYERAVELAPTRASAHGGLGVVYERLGRFEEAIAVYQEAIRLDPANAWLHEALGGLYRQLDHLEEAAAEYERAVELAPTRASAYWGLGVAYEKLGRIEEAIMVYEEILRINPTSEGARQKLEQLSHIMGDVHQSLWE